MEKFLVYWNTWNSFGAWKKTFVIGFQKRFLVLL